jgi:hypothetical protein
MRQFQYCETETNASGYCTICGIEFVIIAEGVTLSTHFTECFYLSPQNAYTFCTIVISSLDLAYNNSHHKAGIPSVANS